MLELITAVATVLVAIYTVGPSVRRWWREHYRHPSWVDAWLHRRRQKAARRKPAETAAPRRKPVNLLKTIVRRKPAETAAPRRKPVNLLKTIVRRKPAETAAPRRKPVNLLKTIVRRKPAETAAPRRKPVNLLKTIVRRKPAETAAPRRKPVNLPETIVRREAETAALREAETAALREAEKVAPDLLAKLQRSLEKSPDRRRFRVRREGAFVVSFVPHTIDCPPPPGDDGDLEGWVARHAADDLLFRLVSAKSSPPVYEMLEELVRHLNGRGH